MSAIQQVLAAYGSSGGAGISFVAQVGANSTNSTSATTPGIDTTGANCIVLFVADFQFQAPSAVSDSYGNTWTALTPYTSGSNFYRGRFHYCANPIVGTGHTFTASSVSFANYPSIIATAFSGVNAAPFDVENGADGGSNSAVTSIQTGSVIPSQNNSLIITGLAFGASAPTIDSGFGTPYLQNTNTGVSIFSAVSYLIQGSASAVNPTWTQGASYSATAIAVFKP